MGRVKDLLLDPRLDHVPIDRRVKYFVEMILPFEAAAKGLVGEITGEREVRAAVPGGGKMTVRFCRDGQPFIYDCSGSHGRAWAHLRAKLKGVLPPPDPARAEARRARAFEIWSEAADIRGTPAEHYLLGRGIPGLPPDEGHALRWHAQCPWEMGTRECMVALFRDVLTDKPVALHRTSLFPKDRKALGPIKNAAIKLWPAASSGRLVVGEGIETVLAAALVLRHRGEPLQPAWAATVAGNVRSLPVLPDVTELTLLVDHDQSGAGSAAAEACAGRWSRAGRTVVLLKPKVLGEDFNDVVQRMKHHG